MRYAAKMAVRAAAFVMILVGMVSWLTWSAEPASAADGYAQPDYYATYANQPFTFDVTDNDADLPGRTTGPATMVTSGGAIECGGFGQCKFTPAVGFRGHAQASYWLNWWTPTGYVHELGLIDIYVGNSAPVSSPDDVSAWRNTPAVDLWVLANDSDPNGDPLTMDTLTHSSPSVGSLLCQGNGYCRYVPPAGWTGTTSFYYRAWDGAALGAATKVTMTVKNRAAVATSLSFALKPGQEKVFNRLAGAYDPDGDPIRVKATSHVSAGTLGCNDDAYGSSCAYTAPMAQTTVVIDFFVEDDLGAGVWVKVTFTVSGQPLGTPIAATPIAATPIAAPATPLASPASGAVGAPKGRTTSTTTLVGPPAPTSIATSTVEPAATESATPTDVPTENAPLVEETATATATATQTSEPTETATSEITVVEQPTETPMPPAEEVVSEGPATGDETKFELDAAATPAVVASTGGSSDGGGGSSAPAAEAQNWTRAAFMPGGLILLIALGGMLAGRLDKHRRRAGGADPGYSVATPIATSSGAAD